MQSDGSCIRRKPKDDEGLVRCQNALIAIARKSGVKSPPYEELLKNETKKIEEGWFKTIEEEG